MFEKRVLRRIFGPKREEVTGNGVSYTLRSLMICNPQVIKLRGKRCSTYGGEKKVHTGFRWGNLKERDRLEDPGVDGRIILRWIFRK